MVTKLAGTTNYDTYERELRRFVPTDDSAIEQLGTVWAMRAPVDAFSLLAYLIGRSDLTIFADVIKEVFSTLDPSLTRPARDRPFDALRADRLPHSQWLRDGLATTLLLIAALHEKAKLSPFGESPQRFVDRLIADLPGLAEDHRLIASLGSQLPLLAEAGPVPLLGALEQLLEGGDRTLAALFEVQKGFVFDSSRHTELLFALETLAWDPEYLSRVARILAKLAALDPGGQLQNRPLNSLAEILMPWNPNTNANLEPRLSTLDSICQEEDPKVAWELIAKLLPTWHAVGHVTRKPVFREAGGSERETLMWDHVFRAYRNVIEWGLKLAGDDVGRWGTLISGISQYEPALQTKTIDVLEAHVRNGTPAQRDALWIVLRNEVPRLQEFVPSDSPRAVEYVERLSRLMTELTPASSLVRAQWLFDEPHPNAFVAEGGMESLARARESAVHDVLAEFGAIGLIDLASRVGYPGLIPPAAITEFKSSAVIEELIGNAIGRSDRLDLFALWLSAQAHSKFGIEWDSRLRKLVVELPAESAATLVLGMPDAPATWDFVQSLGQAIEQGYWTRKVAWTFPRDSSHLGTRLTSLDWERAGRKYLEVDRGLAAVNALANVAADLPATLLMDILDSALREIAQRGRSPDNMFLYHADTIFKTLASRDDVDQAELARREYAYLPLRSHVDRGDLTLHCMMERDPEFYVSVLCDVFKPASSDGTTQKPTAEQRMRANVGFELLRSFTRVPGMTSEQVRPDDLRAWIEGVKTHAAARDRTRIGDQYIGHVLGHSPVDPDDHAWPHKLVREVLEALKSEDIERGMETERFNMRGVYAKAIFEGGAQERALAEKYDAWAKTARRWQRTAGMLKRIARTWVKMSKDSDVRAEQDKLRG
jgi:hypothetical protein